MGTTLGNTPSTRGRWALRAYYVLITGVAAGVFFICAYAIAVNLCTYWYGKMTTGVVTQARHPPAQRTKGGIAVRFEYWVAGERYVGSDRVAPRARLFTGGQVGVRFLHVGPIKYAMCPDGRLWLPHMVLPCVFVLPAGWTLICLLCGGVAAKYSPAVPRESPNSQAPAAVVEQNDVPAGPPAAG